MIKKINLPTCNDYYRVGEKIEDLEDKINEIIDYINEKENKKIKKK